MHHNSSDYSTSTHTKDLKSRLQLERTGEPIAGLKASASMHDQLTFTFGYELALPEPPSWCINSCFLVSGIRAILPAC